MIVHEGSDEAKYAVVFDPLDGSSNIDVNVSVGTTFSILRKPDEVTGDNPEAWVLQPGSKQIAAGYVVYGSSTILVYSAGHGVHGFTLDPAIGAYVLSHENMTMPEQGKYYSVNEAYRDGFPSRYGEYIDRLRSGVLGVNYSSRYIGSMVADFHRTLLKGGVFLYPPTKDNAEGKLRCFMKPIPWRCWPNRREESPSTEASGSWTPSRPAYISARLWWWAAGSKCPISNASFSRVARISGFSAGIR